MTMNAEVKAQWVGALRSGHFQQGKGYLDKDGLLCVMGVLCRLAEGAGVVRAGPFPMEPNIWRYFSGEFGVITTLPPEVAEWAGLTGNEAGNLPALGNCIVNLSDSGVPFPELADLIEAYL